MLMCLFTVSQYLQFVPKYIQYLSLLTFNRGTRAVVTSHRVLMSSLPNFCYLNIISCIVKQWKYLINQRTSSASVGTVWRGCLVSQPCWETRKCSCLVQSTCVPFIKNCKITNMLTDHRLSGREPRVLRENNNNRERKHLQPHIVEFPHMEEVS